MRQSFKYSLNRNIVSSLDFKRDDVKYPLGVELEAARRDDSYIGSRPCTSCLTSSLRSGNLCNRIIILVKILPTRLYLLKSWLIETTFCLSYLFVFYFAFLGLMN